MKIGNAELTKTGRDLMNFFALDKNMKIINQMEKTSKGRAILKEMADAIDDVTVEIAIKNDNIGMLPEILRKKALESLI